MKKIQIPPFVIAFMALVTIVFTLFGFVIEQPCNGIDKDSLYCALHPISFINLIGVIMFYAGFVFISGVWALKKGGILLPVGSVWPNFAGFALFVLGAILIFA
jgi:hypothetical protein